MRSTTELNHGLAPRGGAARRSRAKRTPIVALVIGAVLAGIGATPTFAAKGSYTVTVSPAEVAAGSSGNTLTFTFMTTTKSGGNVSIRVPAVAAGSPWTAPQASNPSGAGFVTVAKGTCKSASLGSITGLTGGPWTLGVKANCGKQRSFSVSYGSAASMTAASLAGPHTFSTTQVASQPVVTVQPGAAVALVLGGTADGPAGANRTVSFLPKDVYGNTATGYRGTVQFAGSNDASCWTLPTNYTFNGSEFMFDGVVAKSYSMRCAGEQTLTATDTATPGITGTRTFTIAPGPTHSLGVSNLSMDGSILPGQAIVVNISITATDVFDNVATSFNGPTSIFVSGFGYEPIDVPTEVTLVDGVATLSIDGYALDTHVQVGVGVEADGIPGTSSFLDIIGIPPTLDAARINPTLNSDGLNYDMHLLLRPADPDLSTSTATASPILTATSVCALNADGTCTLLFDGQLATGSAISGSLTLTSAMNVVTHTPVEPSITEGQIINIGGCLEYQTNSVPHDFTFYVPEAGASFTITPNLCQQVADNFAHVTTGGIVDDGTGFVIPNDNPEIVYGMLTTGGFTCTNLFEEYDPATDSCIGF